MFPFQGLFQPPSLFLRYASFIPLFLLFPISLIFGSQGDACFVCLQRSEQGARLLLKLLFGLSGCGLMLVYSPLQLLFQFGPFKTFFLSGGQPGGQAGNLQPVQFLIK